MSRFRATILIMALGVFSFSPVQTLAQRRGGGGSQVTQAGPLRWEYMGPPSSGRFAAVAGIPGDQSTYYLGAASGGVWKTTDAGQSFRPTFDEQSSQAIGSLAVAPSDPNVVWAGTGEAWAIRDADVWGDGIYKSTDAGESWTHMGLTETGRIGRIVIHPIDPNVVYACALGRVTGPQQERGVYRTRDGGESWDRVLFVDEDTGCSGIAMDPNNPDVIFAGTWDVWMQTWVMHSGGPGGGVFVTRDGGDSWTRLGEEHGLPRSPVGKIDVAVAPSDSNRIYALIQSTQGSVWRSDDGGRSWRVVSWDRTLIGRAGFYIRIAVNPENADEVVVMNSSSHRSVDGGLTWPLRAGGCGDCHDVWMDPTNGDHWAVTGDGGAGWTWDHGESYQRHRLPIGQMYHVWIDNQVPYWIYSNRQDDGTMRGPSDTPVDTENVPDYFNPDALVGFGNRREAGGAPAPGRGGFGAGRGTAAWQTSIGGCESGFTIPLPDNPDIIWATCYGNQVTRFDNRIGSARSVSPWKHLLDHEPMGLKYRCHWTPPLAIDPFEEETVYYGCNVIFRTRDQGQSWDVVSPDLSTQDPERIAWSGGIPGADPPFAIGDNLGQFYGEVVFAIAPSKLEQGLIWAGTNDGLVWITRNGGDDWTRISDNAQGLAEWGTIRKIEPSAFDPGAAYVVVDYHLMDDLRPYLFKVTDYGRTWTDITGDLPADHPLDYLLSMAENPNREAMLFAGSGHGFYYTMDDGRHWTQLQDALPASPVSWIMVEPRYHDVVISTYGRGLFVLRDVTRLEQADEVPVGADVHLYAPRPGFRQARRGSAEFLFSLASNPADPVRFEILDSEGTVVRTFEAPAQAGLNTVRWDLMYAGPAQVELRTIPPYNPHIWEEARFLGQETRPIIHWGISGPQRRGPIGAPGEYAVRMTVDGASHTRSFTVLKDPAITTQAEDIAASTAIQVRIRDGMNRTVDMINRLEIMRKQVEDLVEANQRNAETLGALEELGREMYEAELHFLSATDLHSDDKWYVEGYKVYMQYIWLSGEVALGAGDVQGGAEYRPTDAAMEWLETIESELAVGAEAFRAVIQESVPAFNRAWAGRLPEIVVPPSIVPAS
jgi:photosystem II stability/assembly factor-like uncharacterized protein